MSMQVFRLLLVAHCAYSHVNKEVNANNANEMQCCNALEASGWRWLLELVFCVKFKQSSPNKKTAEPRLGHKRKAQTT